MAQQGRPSGPSCHSLLFLVWTAGVSGVRVTEELSASQPLIHWDTKHGGWLWQSCLQGTGSVGRVELPWHDMKEKIHDTRRTSKSACEACANRLEAEGILQSGWRCRRKWNSLNFYLKREGDTGFPKRPKKHRFQLADVTSGGPLPPATAPLPSALRGVFWLTDQGSNSALFTFAGNQGSDCKWCSLGKLTGNGYRIRVMGNRTWAFASTTGLWKSAYAYARNMDIVYDWVFDDPEDPTSCEIWPVVNRLGPEFAPQKWLLSFGMDLTSAAKAEEKGYPGSVVWERRSRIFTLFPIIPYDFVQVVDEHGQRIEPAWSKFVEYQNSTAAGKFPGELFYHSYA